LHESLPRSIGEAFATGNNIQFMRKACGDQLNVELVTLVRNLAQALECKIGMTTAEDFDDALSVIHDFPDMTVEEIRLCFAWIRQGKIGGNWYERFKAPQLRECLGEFSAMRSEEVLEKRHKVEDNYPRLGDAKGSDIIKSLIASLSDDGPKPYTDDWLRGKTSKMTREQRQQLQEKDRQRRAQ
jgi:hypothetical protein